jgi:hypothetical protein
MAFATRVNKLPKDIFWNALVVSRDPMDRESELTDFVGIYGLDLHLPSGGNENEVGHSVLLLRPKGLRDLFDAE